VPALVLRRQIQMSSANLKLNSHSSIERKNKTKYHHHRLINPLTRGFLRQPPRLRLKTLIALGAEAQQSGVSRHLQSRVNTTSTPSREFSSHMSLLERAATAQFLSTSYLQSYVTLTTSFLFFDQMNINIMRIGNYSSRCLLVLG
jgi:hypothetical protein